MRWLLAALLAVTGTAMIVVGSRQDSAAAPPPSTAATGQSTPGFISEAGPSVSPAPIALRIPAIGVDTRLMRLGLGRDHTVEVPPLTRGAPAGWYAKSATPGEIGAAVILGHIDTARDGPAVFYRLRSLRAGDDIAVERTDGSTAWFVVTGIARYPKRAFPTGLVYGPSGDAVLRLVTCGGSFDRARHGYRENLVVYAVLDDPPYHAAPDDFTGPPH